MGSLKPIGSEKLTGQDKINRILEISKYKENRPNNINENSNVEYSISLADSNDYHIVKEKQGYVIKRSITESTSDYIEPMRNRKYYPSYSQAFKRLNLLAKELNKLNENEEGVELFGEQKKFTLKTPKPKVQAEPEVSKVPPALPEPELPSTPEGDTDVPMDDEIDIDLNVDGGDEDLDMGMDIDMEKGDEEQVTFKTIQKLTGKLTQKIRTFEQEEGLTSENIKYVINMVLSSLDLNNLDEEDKDDILSKFEGEDMEDMSNSDFEGEDMGMDTDMEMGGEMEEDYGAGAIVNSIFNESKIDEVISSYFEYSKKEIIETKQKKLIKESIELNNKISEIKRLSQSPRQRNVALKVINKSPEINFIGLTNLKKLVFEHKNKEFKINEEGLILVK